MNWLRETANTDMKLKDYALMYDYPTVSDVKCFYINRALLHEYGENTDSSTIWFFWNGVNAKGNLFTKRSFCLFCSTSFMVLELEALPGASAVNHINIYAVNTCRHSVFVPDFPPQLTTHLQPFCFPPIFSSNFKTSPFPSSPLCCYLEPLNCPQDTRGLFWPNTFWGEKTKNVFLIKV